MQGEFERSCFLIETVDIPAPVKLESIPGAFQSQNYEDSFGACFLPCVAQSGSVSPKGTSNHGEYVGAGDSATGIRIRTRQPGDYSTSTNFAVPQGFAHRRVRIQTKLEFGTLQFCKTDLGIKAEDDKENSTVTEVRSY